MAKAPFNLGSMTVDALLKLRDDIGSVLGEKTDDLKKQLRQLEAKAWGSSGRRGASAKAHPRKGIKVPAKYRGPGGETWAGRGATPRWLAALLSQGIKRDDFLIDKPARAAASRKRSTVKKSRRRK